MFQIMHISRLRIKRDGEGVRTLIITGGCRLRCRYCFNKDTWDGARTGRYLSPKLLYSEIFLDWPYFMATGGGVTFGGGEPLLYADEIREFQKLCRGEFSIYAETSLNVPKQAVEVIGKCVDQFIVDIKTTDPVLYRKYTGGELSVAMENLCRLLEKVGSERITVRIPLIPGMNLEEDQYRSKDLLEEMGIDKFDLFEYLLE